MIGKETGMATEMLIVVGAGASAELGLPVGGELKTIISKLLHFQFTQGGLKGGNDVVYGALMRASYDGRDFNDLIQAALHVHEAVHHAISIDNFIDIHQGNQNIEQVSKLAIVHSILRAERSSQLWIDSRNSRAKPDFANPEKFGGVWLSQFFQLLTERCPLEKLGGRLANVTMIVFNYDRCIEHYLFHAIRNLYRVNEAEAAELVGRIKIFHPYGTVGSLPWQDDQNGIAFGGEPLADTLLTLSGGIRTFTESIDASASNIIEIRRRIAQTSVSLYLGFAFHRINMKLLSSAPAHADPDRMSFATAYRVSDYDVHHVRLALARMTGATLEHIHIRNDLQCHQLFGQYTSKINFE
jgi:hypothetical protein